MTNTALIQQFSISPEDVWYIASPEPKWFKLAIWNDSSVKKVNSHWSNFKLIRNFYENQNGHMI